MILILLFSPSLSLSLSSQSFACHNHIRTYRKLPDAIASNRLFVCGTDAYVPKCRTLDLVRSQLIRVSISRYMYTYSTCNMMIMCLFVYSFTHDMYVRHFSLSLSSLLFSSSLSHRLIFLILLKPVLLSLMVILVLYRFILVFPSSGIIKVTLYIE